MGSAYGCQHTKLILFTHRASTTPSAATPAPNTATTPNASPGSPPWLRVVVGTSNMLPNEVCDKNQAHWVHDAPTIASSAQRARVWRQELYGEGPLLRRNGETSPLPDVLPVAPPPPVTSPLSPLVRARLHQPETISLSAPSTLYHTPFITHRYTSPTSLISLSLHPPLYPTQVLASLHLAARALKLAFDTLATWVSGADAAPAPLRLETAPAHVQALVGVCARLWRQSLADALVLSQVRARSCIGLIYSV